jgi:hypothetical protein
MRTPTESASKIAAMDGGVPLRVSHSRMGHVAIARTLAQASAGKKRCKIQTAARTNIVTRMRRPKNCRDDCSMGRSPVPRISPCEISGVNPSHHDCVGWHVQWRGSDETQGYDLRPGHE